MYYLSKLIQRKANEIPYPSRSCGHYNLLDSLRTENNYLTLEVWGIYYALKVHNTKKYKHTKVPAMARLPVNPAQWSWQNSLKLVINFFDAEGGNSESLETSFMMGLGSEGFGLRDVPNLSLCRSPLSRNSSSPATWRSSAKCSSIFFVPFWFFNTYFVIFLWQAHRRLRIFLKLLARRMKRDIWCRDWESQPSMADQLMKTFCQTATVREDVLGERCTPQFFLRLYL